ncbi:MAG: hypothetical protein KatS3mg077_3181 [Candidatus Binatia bacterium]|nr:MAG: hypothetical protein KatS3mg077_3181 [Candidatus Binatia bacterium]
MRKIAIVAAGAMWLLGASASYAAIERCQKRIQSEGAKLQKFVYSALQKCADAIRKEKALGAVKGGTDCSPGKACLPNAAKFCERQLATVYDAANAKPDKSKFELFRAALEKSSFTNECTDSDLRLLEGMNHQLSGGGNGVNLATAPPLSGTCDFNSDGKGDTNCRLKFLTDWLMFAIEDAAVKQLMAQTPDLLALLKDAIEATSANPAKPMTDCSGTPAMGEEYRPNLCRFGVQCYTAVCNLDSSSNASLQVPGLFPLPPIGLVGSLSTAVCRPGPNVTNQQGLGAEFGVNPNTLYLINSAARTIRAASIPPPLSGFVQAVCVDVLTSEGWCDCSGQGVSVDATVCQDRIGGCDASSNPNCLPGSATTDECGVSSLTFVPDSLFPNSNSHSPEPSITPGGSSATGDCVDFVTMQFKLLTSSDLGTDGIPCTDDDTAGPLASFTGPLTTGTVNVTLEDLIQAAGQCINDSGTPPCLTNADCSTPPCDTSGVTITTATASVSGSKPANACAKYSGGNLSGLKLVTGLALADLAIGPPLNTSLDGTLTVELVCQ